MLLRCKMENLSDGAFGASDDHIGVQIITQYVGGVTCGICQYSRSLYRVTVILSHDGQ